MEETLKKRWDSVRLGVLLAVPLPLVVFGIMLLVLLRHLPGGGLGVYLLSEGTLAAVHGYAGRCGGVLRSGIHE